MCSQVSRMSRTMATCSAAPYWDRCRHLSPECRYDRAACSLRRKHRLRTSAGASSRRSTAARIPSGVESAPLAAWPVACRPEGYSTSGMQAVTPFQSPNSGRNRRLSQLRSIQEVWRGEGPPSPTGAFARATSSRTPPRRAHEPVDFTRQSGRAKRAAPRRMKSRTQTSPRLPLGVQPRNAARRASSANKPFTALSIAE